jgi:hypothetical protein
MQPIPDLPTLPTLPQLWRRLRAMFARAVDELGPPGSIAALPTLPRPLKRQIAGWLALMETILRKLLLAEAVQLSPSPKEEGAGGGVRRDAGINSRASCCAHFAQAPPDRFRPDAWPTRFSLAPPREPYLDHPLSVPGAGATRCDGAARERRDPVLRLAMRFESLRRVLDDPAPHALRLARLLQRRAPRDPSAAGRIAIALAFPYFVDCLDPRLIIEAMAIVIGLRLDSS